MRLRSWKTRPDEGTVIGFLAKYARGLMTGIVEHRIDDAQKLKDFNVERYQLSKSARLIRAGFARKFVPVAGA